MLCLFHIDFSVRPELLRTTVYEWVVFNICCFYFLVTLDALQAKLSEQEQAVQNKDRIIEQQSAEISLLKQQLLAVQQAHGTALSSYNANSSAVTTTDASAAPTNIGEWQAKLDTLTQSHLTALESAHKLYTTKLTAAQQKEQAALQELHRVQLDLKAERERSLQSMRTVRETQNKSNEEENSYKMRISELLTELSTLRDANEDFERSNAQLQAELAAAHEKINQLGEKLLTSVSKEQVKEMEGLFIETVTKLSERVNMLEGKKTGSEKVVTTNNTNNYVGNSSGGSTREVRIEPGGRIRAGSVKDTNSNGNNSGGAYNKSALNNLAGMQYSQSTNSVQPNNMSSNSAGNGRPIKGEGAVRGKLL